MFPEPASSLQPGDMRPQLDEWLSAWNWDGLRMSSDIVTDDPADAISEAAPGADLIVMGTHGRTGLMRFLLGSVAAASLRRSSIPVLVVPARFESWLLAEVDAAGEHGEKTAPAF
jgi:hypothetical protein